MKTIVSEADLRTIDGRIFRRLELCETYQEGDYGVGSDGVPRPVANCIGRKVHKAELGNGWTAREHTPESLILAQQRERARKQILRM